MRTGNWKLPTRVGNEKGNEDEDGICALFV